MYLPRFDITTRRAASVVIVILAVSATVQSSLSALEEHGAFTVIPVPSPEGSSAAFTNSVRGTPSALLFTCIQTREDYWRLSISYVTTAPMAGDAESAAKISFAFDYEPPLETQEGMRSRQTGRGVTGVIFPAGTIHGLITKAFAHRQMRVETVDARGTVFRSWFNLQGFGSALAQLPCGKAFGPQRRPRGTQKFP